MDLDEDDEIENHSKKSNQGYCFTSFPTTQGTAKNFNAQNFDANSRNNSDYQLHQYQNNHLNQHQYQKQNVYSHDEHHIQFKQPHDGFTNVRRASSFSTSTTHTDGTCSQKKRLRETGQGPAFWISGGPSSDYTIDDDIQDDGSSTISSLEDQMHSSSFKRLKITHHPTTAMNSLSTFATNIIPSMANIASSTTSVDPDIQQLPTQPQPQPQSYSLFNQQLGSLHRDRMKRLQSRQLAAHHEQSRVQKPKYQQNVQISSPLPAVRQKGAEYANTTNGTPKTSNTRQQSSQQRSSRKRVLPRVNLPSSSNLF